MSFNDLIKGRLKISTVNLLRIELFIGFLVVNFFSIALTEFGFEGYNRSAGFLLSAFYLGLLFVSIAISMTKKYLSMAILLLYTISVIIVLTASIDRNYEEGHYLGFLFVYAFFCFSQSKIRDYVRASALILLIIIGTAVYVGDIEISYVMLIGSYLLIFLTGLTITASRTYLKDKLVRRQKLLNEVFQISPDGLVLLNIDRGNIVECNQKFFDLFPESQRKSIIGSKLNILRLGEKHLFKQIDFERAVSIELRDGRIINIVFQALPFGKSNMALAIVKSFKNKDELNRSFEFDRLLTLSEESYKYLFEESSSLICILDEKGTIVDVNKTTTAISAFEKDELVGQRYDFMDFEPSSKPNEERELINQKAWNGEKQKIEKAIKGVDGKKIELEVIIQRGKYFGEDVLICNSRDINERKALEKELVSNYDKFIALFELSPIGIMASDLESNVIDFNGAFLNLLGYSKERASQLVLEDILHPDDLKSFISIREKIQIGPKVSEEAKLRLITSDNREIHTILNVVLQNNSEGDPAFFLSQIIDISDILEGQKQLEESEFSYRELFNNSSELIYLIDETGKFVDINQTVLDQYGYNKEELMASGPEILFAPDRNDIDAMQKKAGEVMAEGKEVNFLFWSKKKNGEIFPKDMKIKRGYYKGKPVMMITGSDISESYRNRKELEEKEKRYRDLFERNLAGVYRTQKNGKILECNAAFARIFGYESPELIKETMNANDFYSNIEQRNELLKKLENSNNIEGWQVHLKQSSGEIITALLNVSRIKSEDAEYYEGNLIDISELTTAQEQLSISQKKYQQLIDNSSFGIIISDLERKVLFANNKAASLLNYVRPEELVGMDIMSFGKGNNESYFSTLFTSSNADLLNQLNEVQFSSRDGQKQDVELTPTSVLFDNQAAIQLSFIDISDRKKAERAAEKAKVAETFNKILQAELKEKEEAQKKLIDAQSYMEGIIESSLDMIFTTNLEGMINKLNSAAQNELLVKEAEILNKPLKALFKNNKDSENVFKQLEERSSFSGEIDLQRADGSFFPSYFSLSYLYNSEGVRLGIMGVSRDISEIKEKEVEINQQAAKLNAIIESSSHFFFTVNRDLKVTSFNDVFRKDLRAKMGVDIGIGQYFFDTIPQDLPDRDKVVEFWKERFNKAFKGKSSNFEMKRTSVKGEVYFRDIYLNPIYLESSKVEEVSGIGHDITEKKFSEQELKGSLKEKEVLLKEVHHRVKNNMQVISSILSLQSSAISNPKVLDILKESQNRIKAMAFIHERLYRTKDFSQIKFSEYVKSLTESLVSTYDITNKKLKLLFDIEEVFLNLDSAIPCGLILNELISNSLKYAFNGSDGGTISIGLKELKGGKILLSVHDDGVGIPESIEISDTETLGLQLVHTLTEQLEGEIKLTRDKGSKFDLIFTKSE